MKKIEKELLKKLIQPHAPDLSEAEIEEIIEEELKKVPDDEVGIECACTTEQCKSRRSSGYAGAAAVRDAAIVAAAALPPPANVIAIAGAWAAYAAACATIDRTICD